MSQSNGKSASTSTAGVVEERSERAPYRPEASTAKVYRVVEDKFREIVSEAIAQSGHFAYLSWADRDQDTVVAYGHLVDAMECLEIAMTHLGQLKTSVSHRLRLEDEQFLGGSLEF